ncbi:MAG: hypothetical protein LBG24_00520 [Treponema sp.]|jgi:hypothetical protein|nr:hypothetical protein [Treponema sp.]
MLVLKRACFLLMLLPWLVCGHVQGLGKTDAGEPPATQNTAWVLSVTALDVSSLPHSQQLLGEIMTRTLVEALKKVDHRFRPSEEYLYYTHYAWSKSQAAAAKTLVAKRAERDKLLFGGDPPWKYRKTLKALEKEIEKLEEALGKAEAEVPLIAERPVFTFSDNTLKGIFPLPPKPGGEYRFCANQKADAFLAGTIGTFHGRLYISLKLYTLYTDSFQYEDSSIFSSDTMVQAVDELVNRLVAVVSEAPPASLLVHTKPEEAILLVDGSFAGRGEVGPRDYPPGSIDIESFADNYTPLSMSLDLTGGELAELYINLQPLSQRSLTIAAPEEARVYQGSLYRGETPLPVDIPRTALEHFQVETTEGKVASVIIQGREQAETSHASLTLNPKPSHSAEEQRVEKSRRRLYGAYGRFWIALPVAFVINGIAAAHINAYNRTGNPDLYDGALTRYYISIGTSIAAGVALAETFYRIFRYMWTGSEGAPFLVKQ